VEGAPHLHRLLPGASAFARRAQAVEAPVEALNIAEDVAQVGPRVTCRALPSHPLWEGDAFLEHRVQGNRARRYGYSGLRAENGFRAVCE